MTDVVAPDTQCERCGIRGVIVEWDDDLRKYTKRCVACGRMQGAAIAQPKVETETEKVEKVSDNGDGTSPAAITEAKQYKSWAPKPKTAPNGDQKQPTIATAPKPDGSAAKALEVYRVATSRYLEATKALDEAEARRVDADSRVVACLDTLSSVAVQMREARAELDRQLSLLDSDGKAKSFSQRVKVRAKDSSSVEGSVRRERYERTCIVCGATFRAGMPTAKYCSTNCRSKRANDPMAAEPEASEVLA